MFFFQVVFLTFFFFLCILYEEESHEITLERVFKGRQMLNNVLCV